MSLLANLEHADAIVRQAGGWRIVSVEVGEVEVSLYAADRNGGLNAALALGLVHRFDSKASHVYAGAFRGVGVALYVPHAPKEPA